MSETKYTISVPDSAVEQLNQHLDNNIWVDQIEPNDDWQYGSPLSDVKRLAEYWRHKFNWRTAEAKLNELPNYVAKVEVKGHEPLDIHYIHQKSTTKDAVPLLFVHGWPGSVYEATKLLPLLAGGKDGAPAFHVVVPSLPNFGFSGKVKKGGFGLEQYAECLHKLMIQLGYDEYGE